MFQTLHRAETPVLVSVPHGGVHVPVADKELCVRSPRALLLDADLHTERFCRDLKATTLVAHVSRYIIDLNRAPDDVCARACPEFRKPSPPNPRSLIWRAASDGSRVLSRPLTLDELQRRLDDVHRPYHQTISDELSRIKARFGFAILVDLHSMPSALSAETPQLCFGDVRGRSAASMFASALSAAAERHHLSSNSNRPFAGGYITRHHGKPDEGVHALQIEVRRDLYMDERSKLFDDERARQIRAFIEESVETLAQIGRASLGIVRTDRRRKSSD